MYLCEIYSFLLGQSCCLYLIFHSGDPCQRPRSRGRGPLWCLSGGRPAAARRFCRRGAAILPSLTPPTLLFVTCGTMQPSPGGVTRTPPLSPRPFLAAAAFFCLATMRRFAGLSAAVPPLRRRVGRSLSLPPSCAPSQPCRRLHDCPSHAAVASQSSPPASLLIRWALIQQFFRGLLHFRDSRPSVLLESRAHPAAALCGNLLGELLGQLLAVIFPSPGSS